MSFFLSLSLSLTLAVRLSRCDRWFIKFDDYDTRTRFNIRDDESWYLATTRTLWPTSAAMRILSILDCSLRLYLSLSLTAFN